MSSQISIPQAIKLAVKHHQAGKTQQAERIYRQILQVEPEHADANHLLGLIAFQSGNNKTAFQLISRAIEKKPQPAYFNNLGNVLKADDRLDESIEAYNRALVFNPNFDEANFNLGNALSQMGKLNEALKAYQHALKINPDYAEALNNLGVLFNEMDKPDEAIECFNRALRINPNFTEAHNCLGNVFKQQGKLDEALRSYQQALEIDPFFTEALNNLGALLTEKERLEEALVAFSRALKINPNYAEAYYNIGSVFSKLGQLDKAVVAFNQALYIKPDFAEAYNNLGNTLTDQGNFNEAVAAINKALAIKPDYEKGLHSLGKVFHRQGKLDEAKAVFQKALSIKHDYAEVFNHLGVVYTEQGKLDEAVAAFHKALSVKPNDDETRSNLLFNLNYSPTILSKEIFFESIKWEKQHAKDLLRKKSGYKNKKTTNRKLKIGYLSPDFRYHSVAYFFEPLLRAHHRDQVEIYLYSNVINPDHVTKRIKDEADHWFSIVGKRDEEVAEQISKDKIDILIDLAGHTAGNRLLVFAYKPAPIQVSWLGYPNTTGLHAIDYRFTDEIADPVGEADTLHTERLFRLENGFLCYQFDESTPEITTLPSSIKGHITFGSFNNLAKINHDTVKLWSEILQAVPGSHLMLKSKALTDKRTRSRYLNMFKKEGIITDRIELYSWLSEVKGHLGLYGKIDIGLDPFPYNGTTTTCEALCMGVPVITMLGDRHAGRVGASIMHHAGLDELIADNKENYVKLAVRLSKDTEKLAILRKSLRMKMTDSPLCDPKAFAKTVEKAYLNMWERFCTSGKHLYT